VVLAEREKKEKKKKRERGKKKRESPLLFYLTIGNAFAAAV